ncbi:CIA30 family protein [Marinifilum fragile]|uniref:CIA30 family protein n=1 Tax=Marinifilum fragile TaxID=570161 RepID=UPI002AABA576|nr:CIA30 family protein [Marinifilum fragile]
MKTLFILLQMLTNVDTKVLSDFTNGSNLTDWYIVNDVVMGGRSDSGIFLNLDSCAVFKGYVSLENNGGFAMVKHVFDPIKIDSRSKIVMKIKGDGKRYQVRLKSKTSQAHSHINYFTTTGDWQVIEIPFKDFYASFRGRRLSYPNFNADQLSEVAFLIGNKKAEEFQLKIKWIALK